MISRLLGACAALSLTVGCASQTTSDDGGAGGQGVTSTTADVTTTATVTTVTTTSVSSSSGGPCAQDCSTIEVPVCFESKCNTVTHTCEVAEAPPNTPCEDGLLCTVNDTCSAGVCHAGDPMPCDGGSTDPCLVLACDEDEGGCVGTPAANGTSCTSTDPCEANSICQNGHCLGAPIDCSSFDDECHVGECDPVTGCGQVPGNDGFACELSGDPCMVDKVCSAGACVGGTPKDCSALSTGCNNGACEAGTGNCYQVPVGAGGNCLEATDACNQGICDAGGNCLPNPVNDGGSCNDNSSCTINDVCSAGACAGVPDPTYTVYFSEDFSDNSAGWTFDTAEWSIGSATASPGIPHSGTFPDPNLDHTTTSDNGILGLAIGGFVSATPHPTQYASSPTYNLTTAPGTVYLEFWRWLNSDYPSFMINVVEVFDGTTWVPVWTQPSNGTIMSEGAWTKQSYDVTAYKNANFRVRFGLSTSSGAYTDMSGWNIDDMSLASAPCN